MVPNHEFELYQGLLRYENTGRKRKGFSHADLSQRPPRSKIGKFSKQSRKRLHRECLKIRWEDGFHFITLTYQASKIDVISEEVEWKNDLQDFRIRLRLTLPELSAIWKLEFTQKGIPHYHLIAHCPNYSATELRNIVREVWLKVTSSGSRGRWKHAVKVDPVGNMQAVSKYLSKYISKDANETKQHYVGRYWGYINKKGFPSGTLRKVTISSIYADHIRRVVACVYTKSKYNDVRANLLYTENSFSAYLPYHIQSRLFSSLD